MQHPVVLGGPVIPQMTRRTTGNTAIINEADVIRPTALWDRAALDCATHNAVHITYIVLHLTSLSLSVTALATNL